MKGQANVNQQHGVLVLNKPSGPSSAQCLEQIKRQLGQRKIGHAGTLDPLAQGVLVVLLGQATKLSAYLLEGGKIYSGAFKLGLCTDTFDILGRTTAQASTEHIRPEQVEAEVKHWLELDSQEVPAYSAAKHQGKPLYKIAREGKETPVKIKKIDISQAEVLDMNLPWVRFRISCTAGTYVRSLVHSLGTRLGCGAVLTELVRDCSCPFTLEQAVSPDELMAAPEALPGWVIPVSQALPDWTRIDLGQDQAALVRNGAELPCAELAPAGSAQPRPGERAMFVSGQDPLALVEAGWKGELLVWSILRGLWSA